MAQRTSRTRSTYTSDGLAAIQAQLNNLGREIKKVNEKELALIIFDMPEDLKVPLILERQFLSTAHAKIDVFKRNITLRVEDEKIIFKSVKPDISLIKRAYMLSLRERMDLDLEARLIGEILILNRSLNPLYGDYIELNDLNVPLELRRDQADNLRPTIKEGRAVDKPMIEDVKTRNDDKIVSRIIGYPNYYDQDEKIRIDYAYNLKFSCMTGFEFVHANFFPNLPINVMSKRFYKLIMKEKSEFKGRNELGNFANVQVFIRNFYVVTDFIVMENMDPYLEERIRDVVFGETFFEASYVEARRFDNIITIRDEDDSVTYHMVRSNLRTSLKRNRQRWWSLSSLESHVCCSHAECSSCGALHTGDFCCSKGNVEDKILVSKLPKNCARCGHPVDGPYCQGCALLRKKLEEDLVTYFQDFQNTSESSDDSTNVVNAPREPFIVKQDHGVNSSQNPPHIDECCYECGNALDGIFCQ
nr:hypothetical protein [Tanacetum cinerariifolium]